MASPFRGNTEDLLKKKKLTLLNYSCFYTILTFIYKTKLSQVYSRYSCEKLREHVRFVNTKLWVQTPTKAIGDVRKSIQS